MTVRDTYSASVVSAEATKLATLMKATNTQQEAINAVGVNAGTNPQLGCSDSQITAIKAANKAYGVTAFAAEATKQTSIQAAKDILRQTDTHPA